MSTTTKTRSAALVALGWCTTLALAPAPARAQTDSGAQSSAAERAITAGKAGVAAYEQGKWSEALAQFRQAEELYHSPVFALFAARSLRQLGQLLEARAALQKLASETIPPSEPAPWHKAQADARLELAELAAEVPKLTLLAPGASASARLLLDDAEVAAGQAIELNPGPHRASIADGARHREVSFEVAAHSHQQLALSLAEPAPPRPAEPPHRARETKKPPAKPLHGPLYVPGWIGLGTGALAIVAGGVVGGLALNKRSSLRDSLDTTLPESSCQGTRCIASQRAAVDEHFAPARQLAVASDVLWMSGSVLAAAGITLILVDHPASTQEKVSLRARAGGLDLAVNY